MPTQPYSYVTFLQAKQQLANRLYDPTMTFWSDAELGVYLVESLRVWNSLTSYWRDDFTFPSAAATTWYDLTSVSQMPNTLRPLTVTLQSVIAQMEYLLLEPVSAVSGGAFAPWTGSAQFTLDDLIQAVARRRDELISLTGCVMTRSLVPAVAGRIVLPDSTIDIRRIAYLPSSLFPAQRPSVVWPEDSWAEQSFNRNYPQVPAGTPFAYLQSIQPPISFDVTPPPAWSGSYDLLTVNAGSSLTASSAAALLSIPDDWTPTILWGALADLLSRESNARDPIRAAYCESRYRLGVSALALSPALLALRLANVPLQIDSVWSADLYDTSWQAATPTRPTKALHAGLNLVALAPTPDSGPYSLTATVVENAPLPVAPTDPVQIAREDFDSILDYSQHIASFKQGGAEFLATSTLFQRFLKSAALYNSKLAELAEFQSVIYAQSQRDRQTHPVTQPDAVPAPEAS